MVATTGMGRDVAGIQGEGAGDATKYLPMHRTASHSEELSQPRDKPAMSRLRHCDLDYTGIPVKMLMDKVLCCLPSFHFGRILKFLLRVMEINGDSHARYLKCSVRQEKAVAKDKDSGV